MMIAFCGCRDLTDLADLTFGFDAAQIEVSYAAGLVDDDAADVPVPVVLTPTNFDYALATSDGSDLRAFDATGSALPLEVETWQPGGRSLVWVRLPAVSPLGGTFQLAFGDPSLPASADVWAGYASVYHFADSSPAMVADATGNNHGAGQALVPTDGYLGGALEFDGLSSKITIQAPMGWALGPNAALTISVWFKRNPPAGALRQHVLLNYTDPVDCDGWWVISLDDDFANVHALAQPRPCGSAGFGTFAPQPGGYANTDWHRHTIVIDRAAATMLPYIDGVSYQPSDLTLDPAQTLAAPEGLIGERDDLHYAGILDEVRVFSGALPRAHVVATFAFEKPDSLRFGPVVRSAGR